MRFQDWPFLLLLFLIPLCYRFWKQKNRPASVLFPLDVPKNIRLKDPLWLKRFFRITTFFLMVLALSRPQNSYQQTERQVSGIDIVLLMDVSASMNIEDLAETSRLEVAKDTLRQFVRGRDNDRIGLVIFSGEPLTLVPPTLDYGLLMKSLQEVETGKLRDGTAIGDGLSLAIGRLRNSTAKSRIIVLLTDGDNNVGQVDPATAGELAGGYGIKVYTIAIGKEGRVKMPIRTKGLFGKSITTYQWFENALNPEILEVIANSTGGKFYRVTEGGSLEKVFSEINRLERSEIKTHEKTKYDEVFQKPLKLALFFILLELVLGFAFWRTLP